ncbi:VOC family protein [Nakamurella silvestris]|nr:VOC family protein [Nakamurella silvestris]
MTLRVPEHVPAVSAPAPEDTLDHLVYAVPDLEAGLAAFEAATGVRPTEGGRHLGKGTRNYLVGLGPTRYLEIIGPDPDHPAEPGVQVPFGLDEVTEPRLLTWSVHPAHPERVLAAAVAAGVDLGPLTAMSRLTTTGVTLSWRLATTFPLPLGGVVPFVIDWGNTPHPAASGLPQLELLSVSGVHPEPAVARDVLAGMGIELPVAAGPVGLRALLRGPRGVVELS